MKVLMLNPPAADGVRIVREGRCMQRQEVWGTSWAPLTLALIAAILRDAGFVVNLKDCSNDGIDSDRLRNIILEFRPGLIIVNTSTPSITSDLKVADLARGVDSNINTVFFGIHVTALPENVFKENPNVRFIVKGEPEYTLRDLAITLRNGKPVSDVKGLIYRSGDRIIHNEKRPFIENLDELPYPAWDLVNTEGYRLPVTNRKFLLVSSGRGCPHTCKFCAADVFYGKKPRLRSPERIIEEIKYVRDKYNINDFLFWFENAISDRQQMQDISKGLADKVPGVQWVCNGRVDMIDTGLLNEMKKAGCWMIGYGVESGTQRILDSMRKNVSIEAIEKAIRITKKAGIQVIAHVIVGYPGETEEDIMNTLRLVKKTNPDFMQVYCCVPFPGSQLYDESISAGWLESCGWSMYEQNFSVINTRYLTRHKVMMLRDRVIKSFYMNPGKIFRFLGKTKSPGEIFSLFSLAKKYILSWRAKKG